MLSPRTLLQVKKIKRSIVSQSVRVCHFEKDERKGEHMNVAIANVEGPAGS
ncbi:hypothetical protein Hanom_Chr17g01524401 [Helianthus anomalus]